MSDLTKLHDIIKTSTNRKEFKMTYKDLLLTLNLLETFREKETDTLNDLIENKIKQREEAKYYNIPEVFRKLEQCRDGLLTTTDLFNFIKELEPKYLKLNHD